MAPPLHNPFPYHWTVQWGRKSQLSFLWKQRKKNVPCIQSSETVFCFAWIYRPLRTKVIVWKNICVPSRASPTWKNTKQSENKQKTPSFSLSRENVEAAFQYSGFWESEGKRLPFQIVFVYFWGLMGPVYFRCLRVNENEREKRDLSLACSCIREPML